MVAEQNVNKEGLKPVDLLKGVMPLMRVLVSLRDSTWRMRCVTQ